MLAILLSWLSRPRALGLIGLAGLVAVLGVQSERLAHCKADLAAARLALVDPATRQTWRAERLADIAALRTDRANMAALTAALDDQNRAVAGLRAQGAADTARADAALAKAHVGADVLAKAAARLLAARPDGPPCQGADQLILDSLTKEAAP